MDVPNIPKHIEIINKVPVFRGFHKIDRLDLRHERFDGSMTGPFDREVVDRGNAVAVLPYDPVRDEVLLIRQFLPGALAAGENPFQVTTIAGIIDPGETADQAATREAREEAGVNLVDLRHLPTYLPSPGGLAEKIVPFLAIADLSEAGGTHGVATENEDIRAEIFSASDPLRLIASQSILSGLAMTTLMHLALLKAGSNPWVSL